MKREVKLNPFAVSVTYSDEDLRTIRGWAVKREQPKIDQRNKVTDKRIIMRDDVETHFIGLLGEFAVSSLLYTKMDLGVYLAGDRVKDLSISGVSIEVKTLQGYLTFRNLTDFVADIAVLVTYNKNDFHQVSVQGWITRAEFNASHFMDDFGYGPRPCVQPIQLCDISTLKPHCIMTSNFRWLLDKVEHA